MLITLSDEIRNALRTQAKAPLTVEDDQSHDKYVLLPLETYELFAAFVHDDDFQVEDAYAAQSAIAGAAGWDDPEMDVYDNHDEVLRNRENGRALPP